MEKKQNFPSHAGLSGKALIASLFIISGILLFARNVGWITYDLFNVVVSWHSLLIILGIYTMTRRHYLSGATLTLIGVYFLIGGLSWLPENSQTIVWPVALIVAGILFFVKARRRERWMKSHMNGHCRDWARRGGGHMHMNMADDAFACVQLAYDAADHREYPAAGDFEHHIAVILVLVDDILHDAFNLFQLLVHQLHLLLHRYYKYSPFGGICKL